MSRLINALTVRVGTETNLSGEATNQELACSRSYLRDEFLTIKRKLMTGNTYCHSIHRKGRRHLEYGIGDYSFV